ncbi:MAG: leucine-rich repeat domain-containing protein [Clostridia bacterium]|nr:leucine-rich repeat domain-containing protein [Clostridia bacterium]
MKRSAVKAIKCFAPVIKNGKFAFNHTLKSVELCFTVKKIEHSAFSGCSNLENITLHNNLKSIGDSAFTNCTALKKIDLPPSVKALGTSVFKDCKKLKTIRLPQGLKAIPQNTFENCVSIEKIVLPDSIETIEESAFSGCINLKEIVFSENIKTIKDKAFKRCFSLKTLTFPKALSYIGDKCFDHCNALTNVIFNGNPDYIGAAVFPETPCVLPTITGTMFSSSFMQKAEYPLCPTVIVPQGIKKLALGFENTLDYKRRNADKTCFAHILSLSEQGIKLFISERYYSYTDRSELLIEHGRFNFKKYDEQFERADEHEKPLIALYRLTYPTDLNSEAEILYKKALNEKVFYAAMFTVEKNEEDALKYIIENCTLSTDEYTTLYETASKNKFGNLQQMLTKKKEKTGFTEIENFFNDIG